MKIITGLASPAGRLTATLYPSSYVNQAAYTTMALRPSGSYLGRTYRWYKGAVFPFEFGLHYTNFSVSVSESFSCNFSIAEIMDKCKGTVNYLDQCPIPSLPLSITNTGNRTSDYVSLAFSIGTYGAPPYPIKTLATYKRVKVIKPGETTEVVLVWELESLARVDERVDTVLYPGEYTLLVNEPTVAEVKFTLVGEEVVLEKWPQLGM